MVRILVSIFFLLCLSLMMGCETVAAKSSDKLKQEVQQFVRDLNSKDAQARHSAKLMLLRPEYFVRLTAFAPQLIATLRDYQVSEESAILLGWLPLPQPLARKIRQAERTPDKVKARLGDKAAEKRVIADFQNARDLYTAHKASNDLLYLNTPGALKAFANRLQSQEVFTDVHGNQFSLTYILLQCYGQFHPDNALFTSTVYSAHTNITPEQFRGAEHQAYLRKVESYFRQKYNFVLKLDPPLFANDQIYGVLMEPQEGKLV